MRREGGGTERRRDGVAANAPAVATMVSFDGVRSRGDVRRARRRGRRRSRRGGCDAGGVRVVRCVRFVRWFVRRPVGAGTCARAVAGATVSGAMALARDRGGALAALLATPSVGFNAGRRSRVDGSDGSDDRDGDVWGSISYYPSMDSALVDALTPDWRAGDANADARTLATLAADTADDLAAAIADAKRRRRRKYRDDLSDNELSDEFAREVSHAPPLLPLALASHPSARVREAAAASLGERMAAVPSRAPATLPPLLLAVKSASNFAKTETKGSAAVDADDDARAKARAVLASLRAATAGAAHPLGAPVALRALSPLVTPFEMDAGHEAPTSSKGGSKGGDDALKLGFSAAAKTPDPKAHALALVLLADLWCHHKGAFPRLRAALDHASSSREPAVLVGAAAALLTCARKDPRGACDLVGPLRSFLDPRKAPPVARALALETVRTMCDADVLDFYAAFRVVVDSAKKDEGLAGRRRKRGASGGSGRGCWAPGGWTRRRDRRLRRRSPAPRGSARFGHPAVRTTKGRGRRRTARWPGSTPRCSFVLPRRRPTATATRHRPVSHRPFPVPGRTGERVSHGSGSDDVRCGPRRRRGGRTRGEAGTKPGGSIDARARRLGGRARRVREGAIAHREKATKRTVALKGTRAESRRPRTRCCTGCSTPRPGGCGPCQGWTAPPRGPTGDVGNRCGPAGPRAHLLLFRPPPRRSDDLNDLNDDDDAAGDERRRKPGRRAMEVNAELRDVAEAHRRAFVAAATRFGSRPARTGGTRRRRSSRGRGSSAVGSEPSRRRSRTSRNRPPSPRRRRSRPSRGSARRRCGTTRRRRTRGATRRWRFRHPPCYTPTFLKVAILFQTRAATTPETGSNRPGGSPSPRRTRFSTR